MPQLRDLITGDRGLLPYLQAEFGTSWNNFQVRRFAPGKLQGFRAGSDTLEVYERMGTTGRCDQAIVLGYIIEFPGTDGVEAQLVAADFRDELNKAILEWAESRTDLVCDDIDRITGVMSYQQATGQPTGWTVVVVRELTLSYLTE